MNSKVLGIVALAATLLLAGCGPTAADGPDPSVDRFLAKAACESAVEQRLKAPATARYIHQVEGTGPWTVTGTVDSENSFGALVRSSYACTVDRDDEGSMVATLDSLD